MSAESERSLETIMRDLVALSASVGDPGREQTMIELVLDVCRANERLENRVESLEKDLLKFKQQYQTDNIRRHGASY